MSSGKGSARRGTDKASSAAYKAGWDRIFGTAAKCCKRKRPATVRKPYPSWVCYDCATKAGGKLRDPESTTVHTGDCEVCGITQWVTQPRDYGYPRFG
jgi:hypothetical protein